MDGVDNILYNFRKWLQALFFHQTRTTAAIALGSKKKPCIVFSEIYIDVLSVCLMRFHSPLPFCSDPSFFGAEWQKRWCVLNDMIFYYYGTDKGWC